MKQAKSCNNCRNSIFNSIFYINISFFPKIKVGICSASHSKCSGIHQLRITGLEGYTSDHIFSSPLRTGKRRNPVVCSCIPFLYPVSLCVGVVRVVCVCVCAYVCVCVCVCHHSRHDPQQQLLLSSPRLFETLQSLFWSIFGLINLYVTNVDADHQFTEFVGATMFGTYNVISLVVLLNMLIAMMNNSYQLIAVSTTPHRARHPRTAPPPAHTLRTHSEHRRLQLGSGFRWVGVLFD